jgi:hypothetical protein
VMLAESSWEIANISDDCSSSFQFSKCFLIWNQSIRTEIRASGRILSVISPSLSLNSKMGSCRQVVYWVVLLGHMIKWKKKKAVLGRREAKQQYSHNTGLSQSNREL